MENNYKTLSKKQYTVKTTVKTDENNNQSFNVTVKNKSKKRAIVRVYIILTDKAGYVRSYMPSMAFYLKEKGADSYVFNPLVKAEDISSYKVVYSAVYY